MSDNEILDFTAKLQHGLEIAERRMLEEKALHGQDIVVCADDGVIKRVPARMAIESLP